MRKKLSVRYARREALKNAAAFVENADFIELFGDDICDQADSFDGGDDVLCDAQMYTVRRIRKLLGGSDA